LIRTLRLDFHIGRVECVTCQVSVSQEIVGGAKFAGVVALENVGGRIAMFAIVFIDKVDRKVCGGRVRTTS
jgi:hypothetical protein